MKKTQIMEKERRKVKMSEARLKSKDENAQV